MGSVPPHGQTEGKKPAPVLRELTPPKHPQPRTKLWGSSRLPVPHGRRVLQASFLTPVASGTSFRSGRVPSLPSSTPLPTKGGVFSKFP